MAKITFTGKSQGEVELDREVSLLAAASAAGAEITHRCGGHARCGSCRVTIEEGQEHLTPAGRAESSLLEVFKADGNQRLACQTWIQGAPGEVRCKI